MTALRRRVRLYYRTAKDLRPGVHVTPRPGDRMRREVDLNVDETNAAALRLVLEDLVVEVRGDLRTDLDLWYLVIHALPSTTLSKAPGRIIARCVITGGVPRVIR